MTLYNFPFKLRVGRKTLFPTVAKLPEWAVNNACRNAVAEFGEIKVVKIGPYSETGLAMPPESPSAPSSIDWDAIMEWSRSQQSLDDPAMVEWMYWAHAANTIISARMEEYKRLGSSLIGESNDPYIPGLKIEDIRFRSELGRVVAERGYANLDTPRGSVRVPVPGKATAVFKDLISWGAVLNAFLVQWTGVLLKWRELATNPDKELAFPNFNGLVAPQFFTHSSSIPAPVNIITMRISSNKPQTISIKGRNVDDYTEVISEMSVNVPEGESESTVVIYGFPVVPPMVIEMQPENMTKTILKSWSVIP